MSAIESALLLIAKNWNVVELLIRALDGGVSSSRLRKVIEDEMTDAANEQMKRELGR